MLARGFLPRSRVWKLTLIILIVPLFAVSCGSSGKPAPRSVATQVVRGPGFRFSAPAAWHVSHTARAAVVQRASDGSALVSASLYRLGRAYTPDRFDTAAKELDKVAARLAKAANGAVTSSETTTVEGRKIRAYRFTSHPASGGSYANRVGFVLEGKREVELLCQARAGEGDPAGACSLLFSSFTLTG